MNNFKRVTIICGHYGSGKTNVALNIAYNIKMDTKKSVALADLDIVNPYFRSKDSLEVLDKKGIRLICSKYANSNLDIPSLPPAIYSITSDTKTSMIVDVGGDDRGAMVLGRLYEKILEENNYEMLFVINKYRPLISNLSGAMEVLKEIEEASNIKFTGIINNSNLCEHTTAQDVLDSIDYAKEISKECNLPIKFTSVKSELFKSLEGKIENLLPINLQAKI